MTTKTLKVRVLDIKTTSAEDAYWRYFNDTTLPTMADAEALLKSPEAIPTDLRQFDLVFPRAVFPGLSEGGGADKVTDNSIAILIWNGDEWTMSSLLAGKLGWGFTGPERFGPRARLAYFSA